MIFFAMTDTQAGHLCVNINAEQVEKDEFESLKCSKKVQTHHLKNTMRYQSVALTNKTPHARSHSRVTTTTEPRFTLVSGRLSRVRRARIPSSQESCLGHFDRLALLASSKKPACLLVLPSPAECLLFMVEHCLIQLFSARDPPLSCNACAVVARGSRNKNGFLLVMARRAQRSNEGGLAKSLQVEDELQRSCSTLRPAAGAGFLLALER